MMNSECIGLLSLISAQISLIIYVFVFDSLIQKSPSCIHNQICCILSGHEPEVTIDYVDCQRQYGSHDCGLFAIAFATTICFGDHPAKYLYCQSELRRHLVQCLTNGVMEEFPKKQRRSKVKIVNSQVVKVYCICRMPRMADMIACDSCKEWYHADICVSLPQSLLLMKKRQWNCKKCT